jgi:hypothetical protein
MILSCDENSVGYEPFKAMIKHNKTAKILFNGVEQTQCITASEEAGFVIRNELDSSGRPFLIHGDEISRETVYGTVQIIIEDDKRVPGPNAIKVTLTPIQSLCAKMSGMDKFLSIVSGLIFGCGILLIVRVCILSVDLTQGQILTQHLSELILSAGCLTGGMAIFSNAKSKGES